MPADKDKWVSPFRVGALARVRSTDLRGEDEVPTRGRYDDEGDDVAELEAEREPEFEGEPLDEPEGESPFADTELEPDDEEREERFADEQEQASAYDDRRYIEVEPEWEHEAFDEGLFELQVPGSPRAPLLGMNHARATLGFEFDLSYGFDRDVATARAASLVGTFGSGGTFPREGGDATTTHKKKDKDNKVKDGFDTSRDGPRMEIATVPIFLDSPTDFDTVVANVTKFAGELETAAKAKKPDKSITVSGVSGNPIWFEHASTVVGRFPIVVVARGSSSALKYPTDAKLWASPQATLTLPLHRVGMLIDAIVASAGAAPGAALTGGSKQRLGLRSDLARDALANAKKSRKAKLGAALSDGTTVTAADYSDALTGFVTLVVMYFMAGVVLDSRDYEQYAKGYLPINLKTPFRHVFKFALTERERFVFMELYGNAAARVDLYKLAKSSATAATGATRLFPTKTHWDLDRFHASPPTWESLVEHIVENKPNLVTKSNTVSKKNHALGDEILFAPLSSKIDWCGTEPRITVELRRIGHKPLYLKHWKKLMTTVRDLAVKLNA